MDTIDKLGMLKQAQDAEAFQKARDKWWDGLTEAQKRAAVRKASRAIEKAEARAKLAAARLTYSYACPKCYARFPTAEERNAHRRGHAQVA